MRYIDSDLDSIQEMRNLIQNAQISFLQLQNLEQNELNVYGEKFIDEIEKEMDGKGRVLIRPSGTEPLVRVMLEGKNEDHIYGLAKGLADLIDEKIGLK